MNRECSCLLVLNKAVKLEIYVLEEFFEPLRDTLTNIEGIYNRRFYFEKYDHRFHWNREDSIIKIWMPIEIHSHFNKIGMHEITVYPYFCFI